MSMDWEEQRRRFIEKEALEASRSLQELRRLAELCEAMADALSAVAGRLEIVEGYLWPEEERVMWPRGAKPEVEVLRVMPFWDTKLEDFRYAPMYDELCRRGLRFWAEGLRLWCLVPEGLELHQDVDKLIGHELDRFRQYAVSGRGLPPLKATPGTRHSWGPRVRLGGPNDSR